jgi:hypothetical protein
MREDDLEQIEALLAGRDPALPSMLVRDQTGEYRILELPEADEA